MTTNSTIIVAQRIPLYVGVQENLGVFVSNCDDVVITNLWIEVLETMPTQRVWGRLTVAVEKHFIA